MESYSHDAEISGAIEVTQAEFETYLKNYPRLSLNEPDVAAQIREIQEKLERNNIR